jgi:SAM-dependent methyltransferase
MTIYETALGDKLANPCKTIIPIHQYLRAERRMLAKLIGSFDYVVEVGCTYGRYSRLTASLGKQYLGIDNVPGYIEKARQSNQEVSGQVHFMCCDASNLVEAVRSFLPSYEKMMVLFPFNVFGVLDSPQYYLDRANELNASVAIFTFCTNAQAEEARAVYFQSCDVTNVRIQHSSDGVLFCNDNGLHSMAYSEQWFSDVFEKSRQMMSVLPVTTIGKVYANFET